MPDAASVILQIDDREALKTLARIDAKAISQFERNGYKLNLKASSLPLGRITGDFDKFSASIEAAASRVLAFTATTTAVYGLATAINRLFTDSIKLEKQLSIIQSILQTSPSNLQKFSSALFDIANKTGQAFDVAANAASEFARQGLSIEDTLAATSAALAFSKIAAVDAGQAVENLTSTLNTFNNEALSYTDIIDTITTLDNNFAISAAGIADGLKRIGSVASESGIQLKEIASLLSVVQQVSARGAPVIANGLKTIFTRLNRQSVQDTLSSIGVASRDSNGEFRNSIDILRDLANQFDNLSDSQRAYISEQVAGVYQINTLQSAIKALRGEFALYDKALSSTEDSSGSAERRLQILTQTTDSALTKLKNNLFQFFAETGKITLKPIADSFITFTSDQILGSLVNALKSSSGELEKQSSATGASIGDFLIGGIQSVISGPGLVILAASIGKLLTILTSDILKGISVLSGLKKVSITDSDQQKAVNKAIKEGNSLLVERLRTSRDIVERVNILNNLLDTSNRKQQLLTANKMINFGISSVFPKKTNSSGFIPNFENRAGEILEKEGAQEHGYKAGRVYKTRVHDGNGKSSISFVNSAEKIINFTNGKGKKATLVVPPNGFGKGTQIAKNNSNGFVPNFVSASRLIGKGREGSFYRLTKNLGLKRFQKQESKEKTIEAAEKEFLISKLLADISIPGVAAPEIPDTLDRVRRTQSIRKKIVKDDLAVHAIGKRTSAAFSEILEEEMYSRGLWMSDLHGYNYTLNAKGKKFIQENKDYFKSGAGFNTPEEYFDAFARAGGKATIIDAGYAEPQTSELKKRIKSYTQFSNGFIPNFQSKNKQFSIARGLRESTLDYSRGNRGIKIGFIRGIERGDAFMMFRKLVELSARSGQPISSDSLEWQVKKEKEILQAQREGKSKYDLLKILIPQLRYREIEGLETSGRITEFPEGFGKPKISEFSSLKDLEKISKGINPKAILNKGILVEDVESRFTGSKEELIKQNRQLQSSRGIRMKLKGRKASGFVPNFASLRKRLLIDRGSYSQNSLLRYSRDNDKIHFDFVRSNRDGDARDLVAKLLEISSRAGSRTIDIGPLLPQPTLFEAGKRRGYSGFKLLKTTFPQLKIAKAVEGITASGRLIGYKNGSMATFDFNSLQELEQFANQLDEVNEATTIGGLSMKFTGNQEELRKRNRENAYNRRLRNEPIKIKRDFSKGFIPNFNKSFYRDLVGNKKSGARNIDRKTYDFLIAKYGREEVESNLAKISKTPAFDFSSEEGRGYNLENPTLRGGFTSFFKGFVPNFALKRKQFEILRKSGSAALNYKRDKSKIDVDYISGREKGDGYNLFSKLVELSARSSVPIKSSLLIPQSTKFKEAKKNGATGYNLLKAAYPQIRYREIEGLKTSGFLSYPGKDGGYSAVKFSSLDELKLLAEDINFDDPDRIDLSYIESKFEGNKEDLIKRNREFTTTQRSNSSAFVKNSLRHRFDSKGFIPNFGDLSKSNPLKSAQQREMMAGYNKSEVRIGKSLSLISPWNPKGLGVYNKDEGSLAKGISLAKQAGIDPKTKGMSAGHIPNFAIEDKTSDLINKQLSLSNLNFTITEKTNETKWLKEYIDQLQATITGIDIKADEIVKRKIKKLKYLNRKKIKETTNLILERNDLIEEIAYDQEDIAREKEIKKQQSKIVKGRFQKFKEILGGKQDELSIQRRNELQSRALTASFLLPAAFGSIAGPQENRSGFTKTLASIGESVGSGLSVAATLGFTPLGIAAGTVVASFELLRKSSESANYSIDELSKSFDKRKTKNDQEIAAASSVIQSQDQLDNLISSGASSKKIAKAQLKLSQDISKISDIETFTLLSDPNVDSERKREALSQLQERKAKENLALQGIEAIGKKSKEADEKLGMFFSESERLGMKLEREDFIPMIEAILGEIDPEKLNSEIGKTAIQGLNSGRIDIIDFFDRYGQELGMSEVTAKKASKEMTMLDYFYRNSAKEITKYSKDFLTLQQSIDKTSNSAYNLSQRLNKGKLLTTAISDIFFSSNLAFRKSQIESASDIKIKDSSLNAMKEMGDITEREFINQKYQIAKEQSNLEFTGKEKNLVESITSDMLKTLKIDFEKITDTDKSLIASQIESVVSGKGDFDLLDLQKTLLKYSSGGESTQLLEELNSIQQKAANDIEALRSERLASDKTLFTEYSNNNKLLESFIKRNVTKSTLSGDMEKAIEIIRTYDPAAEVKNFQKINKLQQKLLSPSISESERSKIEDEIFNIELEINKAKESLRDAQIITTGRSDIKLNEDFFRKRAYGQAAKAEASTLINAINKRRISTTDLGPLFSERETSDLLGKLSRGQFEDAFDAISIKRSQVSEVDKTISSLFDRLEFLGGSKEGFFMPNEEEKFAASVSEFSSSVSKFVEATLGKRGGAKNLLDKNEDETNVKRFRAALEEKQLKNLEIERQSILNARVNNNEKFLSPENIRSRAESQQRLDQEKILELQKELSEATKKTGKTNRKPEIIREEINFLKTKQYPTRSIGLEGYSQDPLSVIESEIKRIEAKAKILISSINQEYDKELQQLLDPKGKTRGLNLYSRSFTDTSGSIERQNQLTVDVKNLQKFLDDLKLAESKFSVNKDIAQFITDLQENLKLRSTTTPTGELKATQKEVEDSLKAVIEGFILLENPIKEILSKIGASIPNTPPSQASSSAKNNNISNEFASNTTININVNSNISGANQDPQLIAKQVSDVVIASATKVFEKMNREQKLGPLPPRSQLRANV